jgi:hypothetical protein
MKAIKELIDFCENNVIPYCHAHSGWHELDSYVEKAKIELDNLCCKKCKHWMRGIEECNNERIYGLVQRGFEGEIEFQGDFGCKFYEDKA